LIEPKDQKGFKGKEFGATNDLQEYRNWQQCDSEVDISKPKGFNATPNALKIVVREEIKNVSERGLFPER